MSDYDQWLVARGKRRGEETAVDEIAWLREERVRLRVECERLRGERDRWKAHSQVFKKQPGTPAVAKLVYRHPVDGCVIKEFGCGGTVSVDEAGTHDDENADCVDTDYLWINANCGLAGSAGDEVCLRREEVMSLAYTLLHWANTGVLRSFAEEVPHGTEGGGR